MSEPLINRLIQGEQKAFKEAYFLYYDKLFHLGRRFEHRFLSPDDFVQETFLKLYNNRNQLNPAVPFDKQLYVICRNLIINHLKRDHKIIPIENFISELTLEESTSAEEDTQIKRKQLYAWVSQLPQQQQKVYTMHKLENYSYAEIAQITKLSKKTIANHIYLANIFIQKKISNH